MSKNSLVKVAQSQQILSLYKANGYDLPVAVSFTFLSRPRNVKCRGRVLSRVPKIPRYDQRADASPIMIDNTQGFMSEKNLIIRNYRNIMTFDIKHLKLLTIYVHKIFRTLFIAPHFMGRIKQNKKIIVAHAKAFCPYDKSFIIMI